MTLCSSVLLLGFQRSHLPSLPGLLEVTSGGSRLHIEPRDAELVLGLHSTFSLLCYGDSMLVWEREGQPLAASLEQRDGVFVSNLTLRNVTGRHTGEYVCTYSPDQAPEPAERKALYIYVPGRGHHVLVSAFPWGLATRRKRALNYHSVSKNLDSQNPFSHCRRAFMAGHLAVVCLWYARSWQRPTCGVLGQVVGEAMVLSSSIWVSRPPGRGLVILHHGEKVKKHSTSLETEACVGAVLEEHRAALLQPQAAFCNQCSFSPADPSLVFLPTITSEELFIFITGYTEAVIPCRVTNPQMQVTLYEKKVENPIPAAYDPQQGFKGFFEDKTYFCRTIVDDQEVDSDTFYVYRIQGEVPLS